MRAPLVRVALVISALGLGCSDDFVTVELSGVPQRTNRLVVSNALDGQAAQAPEEFEGEIRETTSFALRFKAGTRGRLLLSVEAREEACTVAWAGDEVSVGGRTRVTLTLRPVSPPDCSGRFFHTRTGCNGYIDCVNTCPDDTNCALCEVDLLPRSVDTYDTALACGQQWCVQIAGVCRSVNRQLIDTTDVPPGSCERCLSNSLAGLFKETCPSPQFGDCNPRDCIPLYVACGNDLP